MSQNFIILKSSNHLLPVETEWLDDTPLNKPKRNICTTDDIGDVRVSLIVYM